MIIDLSQRWLYLNHISANGDSCNLEIPDGMSKAYAFKLPTRGWSTDMWGEEHTGRAQGETFAQAMHSKRTRLVRKGDGESETQGGEESAKEMKRRR